MSRQAPVPTLVELPTGVMVSASCRATTDWPSVRCMIESGVPMEETALLFKIETAVIRQKSKNEQWMTPTRVDKLRKEMAALQRTVYAQTGITKSAVELKACIWEERSERWKERTAEIVEQALDGADPEVVATMIRESKDLKTIMEIARTLTGETQAEDNAPKLAINVAFLRGNNAPRVLSDGELDAIEV